MANYFVVGTDEHLLHASIRNHEELANVAAKAERDLISYYTYSLDNGDNRTVGLNTYEADADDAGADFLEKMKDAIAAIINHRLRNYDQQRGILSESLGEYSVTFSAPTTDWNGIPPIVESILADYDERIPVYYL